jgi:hypothetical protein
MGLNTHSMPIESGTTTREPERSPRAPPPSRPLRALLAWLAVVAGAIAVAALAVATFTGGDDDPEVRTKARLATQAEQYERQAHIEGQAHTYGVTVSTTPTVGGNQAEAEQFDRKAHLEGQARTYGNADSNDDESSGYDDEFVPGSRHMPMR